MLYKKSLQIFCKSVYSVDKEPEAFLARVLLPVAGRGLSILVSWNMLRAVCVNLVLSSGIVLISRSHLESFILYSENTPKDFGTMGLSKVSGECNQISCSRTL